MHNYSTSSSYWLRMNTIKRAVCFEYMHSLLDTSWMCSYGRRRLRDILYFDKLRCATCWIIVYVLLSSQRTNLSPATVVACSSMVFLQNPSALLTKQGHDCFRRSLMPLKYAIECFVFDQLVFYLLSSIFRPNCLGCLRDRNYEVKWKRNFLIYSSNKKKPTVESDLWIMTEINVKKTL